MLVTAFLVGRILAAAFACGINLYATVAVIGLASRMGWWASLPPGLRGLENGFVLGSAVFLFFVESTVDKTRFLDNVWDATHTIIRPLAAGMLAWLAVVPLSPAAGMTAGVLATGAALAAHAAKAGLRIAIATRPGRKRLLATSFAEDLTAIGLALAVLAAPRLAAGAALVLAIVLVVFGPRFWRAAGFGAHAATARLRGFFVEAGWRDAAELPRSLRPLANADPLGLTPTHTVRAAVDGLPAARSYRTGWLVFEREATAFLFRAGFRPRRLELPAVNEAEIEPAALADTIVAHSAAIEFRLLLLKDGPAPETVLAELSPFSTDRDK